MNRRFFYFSNQHNLLVRLCIFLLSVGLIVLILPRTGKFPYEFAVGKAWMHEDFRAPFPFAIRKSAEELRKETEEAEHSTKSIYEYNSRISLLKKQSLASELDSFIRKSKTGGANISEVRFPAYEKLKGEKGQALIDEIYKRGLIQAESREEQASEPLIVEVRNGIAEEKLVSDFFTTSSALRHIAISLYGKNEWEDPELKVFFRRFLTPNVLFNDKLSSEARARSIETVSHTRGMVSKGELVISHGEIVTPARYIILDSAREEYENQFGNRITDRRWIFAGQFLIVSIVMGMLLLFLVLLRRDLFEDAIALSFLYTLVVLEVFFASLVVDSKSISIYAFPFGIMPILIRAFFDTRLALFAHLITIMVVGFIVPNSFEFLIIQVIGGMVCIFSIVSMRKRSQLFMTITLLFLVYSLCYIGLTMMNHGSITQYNWIDFAWLAAGASLTLFSYPIIYVIEKVFGFTSDVSLLELSDTNNPLLKELALKAPGTFQHSLQVANLAESAIRKIGGNSLLVRTGALYHDIGKMEFARYFIENQLTGVNPHDELDMDESARIIISHVKRGIQLGRKYNLPDHILDFIRTHHGTTKVQYFYQNFLKNNPGLEVEEAAFRYPGPIPFSRETAVVMMADAVEATSRSMKEVSSEKIDKMVEDIINQQIADNQFINADITFKDITAIKKIFKRMLMNIHHIRVEYPK